MQYLTLNLINEFLVYIEAETSYQKLKLNR